jgi:ribose-phosphate pyrophosphokinase
MEDSEWTVVLGPDAVHRIRTDHSGLNIVRSRRRDFPDGEQLVQLDTPHVLAGRRVLVVHSANPPQDRNFMTLIQLVDAALAARPASLACFVPYLCYQRQDQRAEPGQAVSADLVIRVLSQLGVARLLTVEKHSTRHDSQRGRAVVVNLSMADEIARVCRPGAPDLVVSPDLGGRDRCARVAERLGVPLLTLDKRKSADRGTYYDVVPEGLAGRHCLVVDDVCSSGSTLRPLCEALALAGARLSVFVTHLLVSPATLRARIPVIERLAYTDSCGHPDAPVALLDIAIDSWRSLPVRSPAFLATTEVS